MQANFSETKKAIIHAKVPGTVYTNQALIRLIWPLLIEQALATLVGMLDTVMVSSAGEAAISGVSLVDMVNMLLFNLFAAMATGGTVVMSQALGAKDQERAERSASKMAGLCAYTGLATMAFCFVFRHGIIRLFFGSISQEVYEAALLYLTITLVSYPFLAVYNSGAAFFRSIGNSAVSMKVSLLVNFINVTGNAIGIYVLHMGVAGVAVPTLVSRTVGALVIMYLAIRAKGQVSINVRWMFRPDLWITKKILYIGIPSAVENSIFQLGRVIVVSMISIFGTAQITANAVANNWDGVGVIIGQAFSLAMVTVIGRCVGTGDMRQVVHYLKKLMVWDYVLQGLVNVLIFLFLPLILQLYTMNETACRYSYILIAIHTLSAVVLWPISFVLPNMLRAANDVRFTMLASIGSMFVFRVLLSYILCVQLEWGAIGVWIAMVVDWVCRCACFLGRYFSGKWMELSGGIAVKPEGKS